MLILKDYKDFIGTITFNNPAKRNAINNQFVKEFLEALDEFKNKKARVIILKSSNGTKVWSAGHDIEELPTGEDPLLYSDSLEKMLRAVKEFQTPIIAMVSGGVWGGATDLVLSCDMVIGDETSTFAITPVNLGLAYNTSGLLQFMRRLPLNFIKEMFFTASAFNAEQAKNWGILNHLVPSSNLEEFTYKFAGKIAEKAPLAVSVIKEQLRILSDADPVTPTVFEQIQELRTQVYQSDDYKEGIQAFKEKRKPVFQGK